MVYLYELHIHIRGEIKHYHINICKRSKLLLKNQQNNLTIIKVMNSCVPRDYISVSYSNFTI